jgi:hypothetical protein
MNTAAVANKTFTVTTINGETFLTGNRGAMYFLRSFTGADNGIREIVSCKSGSELRDHAGRVVRVMVVGDIIEAA